MSKKLVAKIFLPNKQNSKRNGRGRSQRTRKPKNSSTGLTTSQNNPNMLTQVVENWMPLTPPRVTKWLRYSDSALITSTTGLCTTYLFAANDCYDPNVTGTGHQPMGYDNMMALYNHFCVVASRLKVTFRNRSFGTPTVCIRQDATNTGLTVIDRVIEVGGCVFSVLEAAAAVGSDKTLELNLDIAKLQGVTRATMTADTSLRGSVTSSPTELTYYHLMAWDSAGDTANIRIDVILEQQVVFSEPRDGAQS